MQAAVTHWGQDRDVHAGRLDECMEAGCLDRADLATHGWTSHDGPLPPNAA